MGFFSWFKEWATRSNRRTVAPRNPDFHPIDVKKLALELRLRDEAKRLGEGGIPASDAKALTAPEAAVLQKVETYRQGYLDWAVDRMKLLTEDLGKLNITPALNHALHAHNEFERKASTLLSEKNQDLRAMSSSAQAARVELETFRRDHGLARDAHWPSGAGQFLAYSIVLFLVAIEGLLNAGFFAQGLDSGWVGGLTYAGSFALANVGLAFILGRWLVCYVNHRGVLQKTIGVLGTLCTLCLIALVGFGIAHFRDAMTAEAADPARAAFEALLANLIGLRDIMSWVLLILSVTFGVIALIDGYKIDDPYPGYGEVTRRTRIVMDDYEAELEEMRQQLEELKDEELADLKKAVEDSQSGLAVYRSRIDEKEAAELRLKTALQDADSSILALLTEFRNENELHRKGLARPKYFDARPNLKELPFPDFSTAGDHLRLEEQATLAQRLMSEVETIRASIQKAFNNQYDLLKPLDAQYVNAKEN